MPQLETASYLSQIFWLIVSFFSLWFCMAQFVIPKIKESIEQRQNKIDSYLEKADQIKKQAESSLDHYNQILNKAKTEAAFREKKEREETEILIEQQKDNLKKELEQILAENEYLLAKERLDTLNAIDQISIKTALLVLKKIEPDENLTKEDLKPFLYKEK